jgi:predicted RNA binding protein YcfA (HicA-like mRNA interferase family)
LFDIWYHPWYRYCALMSRLDKLVARFRSRPPEVDYDEVERLLLAFGWQVARQRGSHVSFVKEGEGAIIVVPKRGGQKVTRTYIEQICEILHFDNYHG